MTVCVIILRTRVLPRWLGVIGLSVSALYLLNQGDILATAVPGFPVVDLAGFLGSTGWGLWVAALGVTLLVRPVAQTTVSDPDLSKTGPVTSRTTTGRASASTGI